MFLFCSFICYTVNQSTIKFKLGQIAFRNKDQVRKWYLGIKTIFEKGKGAFKSNPQSVRPHIKSAEEWGYARVYASVNKKSKAYKIDKIHLKKK